MIALLAEAFKYEEKLLCKATKQAYREKRDQAGRPIHAFIAGFKAYQDLMRIKTNWCVSGMGMTITFGGLIIYELNWGVFAS